MPSREQFHQFVATHGQIGANILTVMARRSRFLEVLNTAIGQELLLDVAAEMEALLDKIVMEKATKEDKADFRSLRKIMNRWNDKIKAYNVDLYMVDNNTIKKPKVRSK